MYGAKVDPNSLSEQKKSGGKYHDKDRVGGILYSPSVRQYFGGSGTALYHTAGDEPQDESD